MTPLPSEDWVVEAFGRIMDSRRNPIDRRIFDREVKRLRDPRAYAIEQRRIDQLRQLRAEAEADARTTVHCAQCDATLPAGTVECDKCGAALDPDALSIEVGLPLSAHEGQLR